MGALEIAGGPGGSIVLDDRYEPIVIATWFGAPDSDAIRRFFAWNDAVIDRARLRGGYVLISDSNEAKRPAPLERRLISELTLAMPEDAKVLNVGNYVVLNNPLIRGALTAMQWLSPSPWAITTVGSCADAITRSLEDLKRAKLSAPDGLDAAEYRAPPRPNDA